MKQIAKFLSNTSIIISFVLILFPAFAGVKYVSKTGELIIEYGDKCSTVKPSGTYRFRNDVAGVLISLDCKELGGDIAFHKFTDNTGSERCFGRMAQYWGVETTTVWEVDGTVPGYRCSRAGKTFSFEMNEGVSNP